MTEHDWEISKDPAAMLAHFGAPRPLYDRQLVAWVLACREACLGEPLSITKHISDLNDAVLRWCIAPASGTYSETLPLALRCHYIRDIWGNPFQQPTVRVASGCLLRLVESYAVSSMEVIESLEPVNWLAWQDGLLPKMAAAIHADRSWGDLGPFADALEEAGCTDPAILAHCRGMEPCPWCKAGSAETIVTRLVQVRNCDRCKGTGFRPAVHVRGCWCLQLFMPEPPRRRKEYRGPGGINLPEDGRAIAIGEEVILHTAQYEGLRGTVTEYAASNWIMRYCVAYCNDDRAIAQAWVNADQLEPVNDP
jgi:hypothetical protein